MNASWHASDHWFILGSRLYLATIAEPRAVHASEAAFATCDAAFATCDAATVDSMVAHDYANAAPPRTGPPWVRAR